MNQYINIVLAFLSLFCFSANADLADDISDLAQTYHKTKRFHGNIVVKHKGEILYEGSTGEAVVEWAVPHTKNSKFMIASLSKSFTSAMVLILQHQGKLSIEDLVSNYISLPRNTKVDEEKWAKLRIKDLMGHRGGLTRDFKDSQYLARTTYSFPLARIEASFIEQDPFVSSMEPGRDFNYSNLGYLLLTEVIESANAGFYIDQLKRNILNPLGMQNTGEFHRGIFIDNMTQGYHYNEDYDLVKRCCDDATALRGSASLYSTAGDLILWLESLSNSKNIFGFDLLKEMLSDLSQTKEKTLYGYGLESILINNRQRISHIGHEWGYISSMSLYPEEDLEVVVLSNRHNLFDFGKTVDDLSKEIEELILRKN